MADATEESGTKMTIVVKTPKEKRDIQIEEGAGVKEVNIYLVVVVFGVRMAYIHLQRTGNGAACSIHN